MSEPIIVPRQSWWERATNAVKAFSPQVKQALIAAAVTALVAIGGCISTSVENSRLKTKVHDLELEVLPFRNLAVQQFSKADADSMRKLAEQMATLHKDYSNALASMAALEVQLQALRETTAPRSLAPEQRRVLLDTLRSIGKHSLRIIVPGTDGESQRFAEDLRAVFMDAGWDVPQVGGALFSGPPMVGIHLRAGQNPAPPHLWVIHDTLKTLGIVTAASLAPNLKGTDKIEIVVGRKP